MRIQSIKVFVLFLFFSLTLDAGEIVNDVTKLNPIFVNKVIVPISIEEIQKALNLGPSIVSIGGGRFSMGGQTATENALQIDMRKMNKIINLDVEHKKITVQAGIRWRDIQDAIDPHNLSVKIMQTYSNFTVGGSLSVNVHGRYIGQGPLIRSVDSIKVVLADGTLINASPTDNTEIFYGAIGGYGGIGVIVQATLKLADNVKVERIVKRMPSSEYSNYFFKQIRDNPKVIFQNGDIYPPNFTEVNSVSFVETDKPLTITDRLIPRNQKYKIQPMVIDALSSLPMGTKVRSSLVDPYLYYKPMVVWRNHEASYDVAELEPASRSKTTYVLQEYFVPVKRFNEFVPKMARVFQKYNVDVVNVSIRHALPDSGSLLAWAREEVFAFVVYYRQKTTPSAKYKVAEWTREMISEALSVGGTYYLPYQIHATEDQFHRAYPRFQEYIKLKKKVDPKYRFRNKLWDRYYLSVPDSISNKSKLIKDYRRGEEQSFLSLPEWYIVFNGDEYAEFLKSKSPSQFPYTRSIVEFWSLKRKIDQIIHENYKPNWGYSVMLWIIGSSYSVELAIKGIYENIFGRFVECFTSNSSDADKLYQQAQQNYTDFTHDHPFYEFSYLNELKNYWRQASWGGDNIFRKLERRVFFTAEFGIKIIYGALIRLLTHLSYESEPLKIYAIVSDPLGSFKKMTEQDTRLKIIAAEKDVLLVSLPRYDQFREILKKYSGEAFKFIEIAGNRRIFLTLIVPLGFSGELLNDGIIVGSSNIPTDSARSRLLVSSSVVSLKDLMASAKKLGLNVEHVFDY